MGERTAQEKENTVNALTPEELELLIDVLDTHEHNSWRGFSENITLLVGKGATSRIVERCTGYTAFMQRLDALRPKLYMLAGVEMPSVPREKADELDRIRTLFAEVREEQRNGRKS